MIRQIDILNSTIYLLYRVKVRIINLKQAFHEAFLGELHFFQILHTCIIIEGTVH